MEDLSLKLYYQAADLGYLILIFTHIGIQSKTMYKDSRCTSKNVTFPQKVNNNKYKQYKEHIVFTKAR